MVLGRPGPTPSTWKGAKMVRKFFAGMVILAMAMLFGPSANPAEAATGCTSITGNWWVSQVSVGTPLFHLVVADKVVPGGGAVDVCIWMVADRKPSGGHSSVLDVAKPGADIHVASTTKWTLITPKPFRMYAGQKFTITAKEQVKDPASPSGRHTVTRKLTVDMASPKGPLI